MAIITISRKIASFGDETAIELAKLLNYNFIDRKSLEKDLLAKGISEVQLKNMMSASPAFGHPFQGKEILTLIICVKQYMSMLLQATAFL